MIQTVWRNKRNPKKHIVLKRYACGHYYWAQYIENIYNPDGKQWIGGLWNRCRFSRVTCPTWRPVLLEDYEREEAV